MKITPKSKETRKFQVGGNIQPEGNVATPTNEGTPDQGAEQDPIMILAQMSAQALQSQDCQMAMQVCQAFLDIVQQMQAPEEPQGEPVFRKGGSLVRRIKK